MTGHDPNKCQALTSTGRWHPKNTGHAWLVDGCNWIAYNGGDIKTCVGKETRKIILAGDSHLQDVYWRLARRINPSIRPLDTPVHEDLKVLKDHVDLQYLFDPSLNGSSLLEYVSQHQRGAKERPILIVIGAANHHIEKGLAGEYVETIDSFTRSMTPLGSDFTYDNGPDDLMLFAPAQEPFSLYPNEDPLIRPFRELNSRLDHLGSASFMSSFVKLTEGRKDMYDGQGTKVTKEVSIRQADILLNLRCNAVIGKDRSLATCECECQKARQPVRDNCQAEVGVAALRPIAFL